MTAATTGNGTFRQRRDAAADGVATLALPGPSGTSYCLWVEKDDRCGPACTGDRQDVLARECPACPSQLDLRGDARE
jgi:hypothetical protein